MKLKIFVIGHSDFNIPEFDFLEKVNCSKLEIEHQNNQLGENRIYLSDIVEKSDAEYVGFVSWRYEEKRGQVGHPATPLISLDRLELSPNVVWCPWPANNWAKGSIAYHTGIEPYLKELSEHTKLPLSYYSGIWANSFICHKSVYLQFQKFFRDVFDIFHKKYGFNFNFYVPDGKSVHPNGITRYDHLDYSKRKVAVFYERVATLYFSARHDLILKTIP